MSYHSTHAKHAKPKPPPAHHKQAALNTSAFLMVLAMVLAIVAGAPAAKAAELDAHQLHMLHLKRLGLPGVSAQPAASGIAAYAEQFASGGYYYVMGGEGPRGFDCSGLAQTVYAHFGLHIPRTADEQANYLHRTSDPQPGDLVFYWGGNYAFHTAIYLGSGMVVSALDSAEGIRVTPVNYPGPVYSYGTLR